MQLLNAKLSSMKRTYKNHPTSSREQNFIQTASNSFTQTQHIARRPLIKTLCEAFSETIWPTRCAICDRPNELVCPQCKLNLIYLDWWQACPRCGAPQGKIQCTECNELTLAELGKYSLPFEHCASAVILDNKALQLVRIWKDLGERRLVEVMAKLMTQVVNPAWLTDKTSVVPIPATAAARRRRGFDHSKDLSESFANQLNLETYSLFKAPHTRDQRKLSRSNRLSNMAGCFRLLDNCAIPKHIILVDDVYTTGATLLTAAETAKAAGVETVSCITFARTW